MSEHKSNLDGDSEDAHPMQLPKDLAQFEQELRMLQPVAPEQLDAQKLLSDALGRELSPPSPAGSPSIATLAATAIISSALTAAFMFFLRPEPEVVERIRVVNAAAEEAPVMGASKADADDDSPPPDTASVAWTTVGSRAAEIRHFDQLLRDDADRGAPGVRTSAGDVRLIRSSVQQLREMLNDG